MPPDSHSSLYNKTRTYSENERRYWRLLVNMEECEERGHVPFLRAGGEQASRCEQHPVDASEG